VKRGIAGHAATAIDNARLPRKTAIYYTNGLITPCCKRLSDPFLTLLLDVLFLREE